MSRVLVPRQSGKKLFYRLDVDEYVQNNYFSITTTIEAIAGRNHKPLEYIVQTSQLSYTDSMPAGHAHAINWWIDCINRGDGTYTDFAEFMENIKQ